MKHEVKERFDWVEWRSFVILAILALSTIAGCFVGELLIHIFS